MNVMLNFKQSKDLQNNDIIVCVNGVWTNVSRDEFLAEYKKQVKKCQDDVDKMEKELNDFKEKVNSKLSQYHKILQKLTEEE